MFRGLEVWEFRGSGVQGIKLRDKRLGFGVQGFGFGFFAAIIGLGRRIPHGFRD